MLRTLTLHLNSLVIFYEISITLFNIVFWSSSPLWCCSIAVENKVITGQDMDNVYNQTLRDEWHQNGCDELIANYGIYACNVVVSLMEKGGNDLK